MMCLHPIYIKNPLYNRVLNHRDDDTSVTGQQYLAVRCNHCYFCRKHKVNEIGLKIKHERETHHKHMVFVTWTFNNVHLPDSLSFDKDILVKAIKRLRRFIDYHNLPLQNLKFFHTGEYGHRFGRPHFHSLIIGCTRSQIKPVIDKIWTFGFTQIVDADSNASRYVTKYMLKDSFNYWYKTPMNVGLSLALREARLMVKFGTDSDLPACDISNGSYTLKCSHNCKACPIARKCLDMLLHVRKSLRHEFLVANKIAFSWKSINLGKQYCLEHAFDIVSSGLIYNGVSSQGQPINMAIPATYKKYIVDNMHESLSPVYKWRDLRDISIDFQAKLDSLWLDPNFTIFVHLPDSLSDDEIIEMTRQGLACGAPPSNSNELPAYLQAYDTWLCSRLLKRRLYNDNLHDHAHKVSCF